MEKKELVAKLLAAKEASGKTYDELFNNLREAISLFLEDEDLSKYDIQANPAIIANLELSNMLYA